MGLKLYVNNEEVWESEGDTRLVSSITGSTARGEFGRLGVANDIDRVDLFISVRDPIEASTDLDIREATFRNQNSEELEKRIQQEGQSVNPANSVFNQALEDSRNPTSGTDTAGTEAGTESEEGTSTENLPNEEDEEEDTSASASTSETIRIG